MCSDSCQKVKGRCDIEKWSGVSGQGSVLLLTTDHQPPTTVFRDNLVDAAGYLGLAGDL